MILYSVLKKIDKAIGFFGVSAHCDIPCKIYDPSMAQVATLSAIRMTDLIAELDVKDSLSAQDQAQLVRLVTEKEEQAAIVKEEVRIIWGDYFKQPQFDQVEGVNVLVHNIMLQASKVKQHIARENAVELLVLVNQFTEAFWLTKGVGTYKAVCPYLPSEVTVYPKLTPVE